MAATRRIGTVRLYKPTFLESDAISFKSDVLILKHAQELYGLDRSNRSLIRVMVRRDTLGRYRGSFGGAFWTIINPLLLMLTYFFVFGVVLRDR